MIWCRLAALRATAPRKVAETSRIHYPAPIQAVCYCGRNRTQLPYEQVGDILPLLAARPPAKQPGGRPPGQNGDWDRGCIAAAG
jgi:hypothetical protein